MNHGMRLSMFTEFSKLKLLAVAETRFASVVVMLKRFLMVKRALQNMVISDAWESYRDDNSVLAQHVSKKILSNHWWENVISFKFNAIAYALHFVRGVKDVVVD
jgi:N-glycosylase/DNA lyase